MCFTIPIKRLLIDIEKVWDCTLHIHLVGFSHCLKQRYYRKPTPICYIVPDVGRYKATDVGVICTYLSVY